MIELTRYFEAADGRGSYWARQQKLFAKQREETAKREKLEDKAEADVTAFTAGAAVATEIQIQAFEAKLDRYETATVEALISNDKAMEVVEARIAALLDEAYVIEDGRRVFKTEDGAQVFDEFGEKVGREFVSPDDIDDSLPTWEEYAPHVAHRAELQAERQNIIEFQERLDNAREEIADGDITEAELEDLDAQLEELMPPAVSAHVRGMESATVEATSVPTTVTNNVTKTLDF